MYRIWCERRLPATYTHLLEGAAEVVGSGQDDPAEPLAALPRAQAIIAGARIRYDGALMDQAPELEVISRTGIGYDNILVPAATQRGIAVCNAPEAPTLSTAEHTLTLMLAVAKEIKRNDRDLRHGEVSDFFNANKGLEMAGLQLGLVGLGRIGSRVARFARALDMQVLALDPYLADGEMAALGVERAADLAEILSRADIVSLHAPLSAETRHLINAEHLAQMKPGAILINAARGGLVHEQALLAALERGHLHGAGLDAFDPEPPHPDNPLLHRDDVIATPHIAPATLAGKERLWSMAMAQALQVLRGERPPHLVDPDVWERRSGA